MTTTEYYNFTEELNVFIMNENDILIELKFIVKYLYDIVQLHIYPFILFIITRNIENQYFIRFLNNISFIIFSHIYFIYFFTSFSIQQSQSNSSIISLQKQDIEIDYITDILEKSNVSTLFRLYTIFNYIIIVEFLAYLYHRLVHTSYFYHLHSHDLSGTSYYYLLRNKSDILAQCMYIYYPLLIVPIKYLDFTIIYYFYIFIGFLSNTYSFSKIHNTTKKYNYSLGIPIFDIIFGTYLSEKKYLSLIDDS